jgi:5'-nucleotidase
VSSTSRRRRAGAALAALACTAAAAAEAQAAPDRTIDVQMLAINDYHGHLEATTPGTVTIGGERVAAGGAAFLSAHLDRLESENRRNTLRVGTGDLVGASPLISSLFREEPAIESLDLMDLDLSAVGNHEFDKGYRELLRLQDGDGEFPGADFDYLAANVVKTSTGKPILRPWKIERVGGVKVGFIGVVTRTTPTIVTAQGIEGLEFLDEAETINKYVPELRKRNVGAIVALVHEGGTQAGGFDDCTDLSGAIVPIVEDLDRAVDVVLSGHTHQGYNCRLGGRPVISGLSFGRLISDVDMVFDRRTRDLIATRTRNVPVTQDIAPDPELAALVERYRTEAAPLANRVIGSAAGDLTREPTPAGESALGDLIADAQLAATQAAGAQIALMNPGGIRSDILASASTGGEAAGEITFGEAFTVQPFGNSLTTLTLSGEQLRQVLEQQFDNPTAGENRILQVSAGFAYSWDASRPAGQRVDPASLTLGGTPVDPAASYRVTVNSFLAEGGDAFTVLREGTDRVGGGQDIDALEAYLAANRPVAVPARDRITRTGG